MHHITSFSDEKFINFLGRGTALPRPTPFAAYGASILASSALDLRPLNVPVALTPMRERFFRDLKSRTVRIFRVHSHGVATGSVQFRVGRPGPVETIAAAIRHRVVTNADNALAIVDYHRANLQQWRN